MMGAAVGGCRLDKTERWRGGLARRQARSLVLGTRFQSLTAISKVVRT